MKFSSTIIILILNLSASSYALPQGIFGAVVRGADDVALAAAERAGVRAGTEAAEVAAAASRGAVIAGKVATSARGIEAAGTSLSHAGDLPSIARPGALKQVTAAEQASASTAKDAAQTELDALKRARREAAKAEKAASKKSAEKAAADKAKKTAEMKANEVKAAAANAKKQQLMQPDLRFNGLPQQTSYKGHSMQIQYSKGFNMKHFHADRSGLEGATQNTVIKNPAQVKWGLPSRGTTGTGNNQVQVMVFKSTKPVDVQVFEKGAGGKWALKETKREPVSASGIIENNKILITHFEG